MGTRSRSKSSRDKVRAHRKRLRQQGLRPIQIWVPDMRSPIFVAEARRQSLAVASSPHAKEDQDFIDAVSDWGGKWSAARFGPFLVERTTQENRVRWWFSKVTDPTDAPLFRLLIKPSASNGLRAVCRLMVDKVTTVQKTKIGVNVGRLADEDMVPA